MYGYFLGYFSHLFLDLSLTFINHRFLSAFYKAFAVPIFLSAHFRLGGTVFQMLKCVNVKTQKKF